MAIMRCAEILNKQLFITTWRAQKQGGGTLNSKPPGTKPSANPPVPAPALVAAVEEEEEDECSICLAEFVHREKIGQLKCGHCFHTRCITRWLKAAVVCPNCRYAVLDGERSGMK